MALTKHQKLARGIKSLLNSHDNFHLKVAKVSNVLQLHFYETYLIIGRPLMTERTLGSMMYTHLCGLKQFASNEELRTAAQSAPLIGCVLTPRFYPVSRVLINPPDAPPNVKGAVPWGVKFVLPSENLSKLNDAMLEALLYCAAEDEMPEWLDWFEEEDIANTFTNQIMTTIESPHQQLHEQTVLEKNLNQEAYTLFHEKASEYQKKTKDSSVFNEKFKPEESSTVTEAYALLSKVTPPHTSKDLEAFLYSWRDQLEELIFTNLRWSQMRKRAFLEEKFSPKARTGTPSPRWNSGLALYRQTYGSFIRYFAKRFLKNTKKHKVHGEIALLLWVMIYISRDPDRIVPITQLLELTTADVKDQTICVDGHATDISCGLTDLLTEYTGGPKSERQQKLFPNLTIDKLEDYFHRASLKILPPGSIPALPEAFLTFPHSIKHLKMLVQKRHAQQKYGPQIYHNLISRHELKRQLIEKSKPRSS